MTDKRPVSDQIDEVSECIIQARRQLRKLQQRNDIHELVRHRLQDCMEALRAAKEATDMAFDSAEVWQG